jgi:hypothetical protein
MIGISRGERSMRLPRFKWESKESCQRSIDGVTSEQTEAVKSNVARIHKRPFAAKTTLHKCKDIRLVGETQLDFRVFRQTLRHAGSFAAVRTCSTSRATQAAVPRDHR